MSEKVREMVWRREEGIGSSGQVVGRPVFTNMSDTYSCPTPHYGARAEGVCRMRGGGICVSIREPAFSLDDNHLLL
jgi:hypothetical protein